jgi:hypothetical protein
VSILNGKTFLCGILGPGNQSGDLLRQFSVKYDEKSQEKHYAGEKNLWLITLLSELALYCGKVRGKLPGNAGLSLPCVLGLHWKDILLYNACMM